MGYCRSNKKKDEVQLNLLLILLTPITHGKPIRMTIPDGAIAGTGTGGLAVHQRPRQSRAIHCPAHLRMHRRRRSGSHRSRYHICRARAGRVLCAYECHPLLVTAYRLIAPAAAGRIMRASSEVTRSSPLTSAAVSTAASHGRLPTAIGNEEALAQHRRRQRDSRVVV